LLGSWWAYHKLGWGGWWFWDPIENAFLMPWILATACIHSVILPKLNYWTFFLPNIFGAIQHKDIMVGDIGLSRIVK